MNRIVLIGNGFDIAHGIPTGYVDFINWYWNKWFSRLRRSHRHKESDMLCSFKIKDEDTWFSRLFCTVSIINPPTGQDFIDSIINDDSSFEACLSPFLKEICKSIETKGWVDIETEYYKLLRSFLHSTSREDVETLNKELDYVSKLLTEYLSSLNVSPAIINEDINACIYSPVCENDIAVSAKKDWENFILVRYNDHEKEYLNDYYSDFESAYREIFTFNKKFEDQINYMGIQSIDGDEFPKSLRLPNKIMLLNFNYTNIADMYMMNDAPRFCVNHIHGTINNPESIIFGYGDELDENFQELLRLQNNTFLQNIKSINYLASPNYREFLSFIESAPYQVFIMGHSCGNSDRTLLNTLFEHKNCISIKPFYHKKKDGTDNYLDIIKNISRNFINMQVMRDKVVNKKYCTPLPQNKI